MLRAAREKAAMLCVMQLCIPCMPSLICKIHSSPLYVAWETRVPFSIISRTYHGFKSRIWNLRERKQTFMKKNFLCRLIYEKNFLCRLIAFCPFSNCKSAKKNRVQGWLIIKKTIIKLRKRAYCKLFDFIDSPPKCIDAKYLKKKEIVLLCYLPSVS